MVALFQKFTLIAALVTLFEQAPPKQSIAEKKLLGKWVAHYALPNAINVFNEQKANNEVITDTLVVTFSFAANNHGSTQWGKAGKINNFTYHLINRDLIELTRPNYKSQRYLFNITNKKLSFSPYPIPKIIQESSDLFCELDFSKYP